MILLKQQQQRYRKLKIPRLLKIMTISMNISTPTTNMKIKTIPLVMIHINIRRILMVKIYHVVAFHNQLNKIIILKYQVWCIKQCILIWIETTTLTYVGDVEEIEDHIRRRKNGKEYNSSIVPDICFEKGHFDAVANLRGEMFIFKGRVKNINKNRIQHTWYIKANYRNLFLIVSFSVSIFGGILIEEF